MKTNEVMCKSYNDHTYVYENYNAIDKIYKQSYKHMSVCITNL